MALKEILDKIQGKLPADAGEEIMSLLADAKREATTILSDLSSANNESKSRKEKIRELESEKDTLTQEIAKLSSNDNKAEIERLKAIEAEYSAHKADLDNQLIADWKKKAEIFNIPSTDKRHSKIESLKPDFVLSDDITVEQARSNLDKFNLLSKANAFDVVTPGTDGKPPIGNTNQPPTNAGEAYVQQLNTK